MPNDTAEDTQQIDNQPVSQRWIDGGQCVVLITDNGRPYIIL